jgi:hypothetical protein
MLGEHVVQGERGKIVGTRILPSIAGQGPKTELTFQSIGKLLGLDFNNTGTVQSVPRSDTTLHAEGQGFVVTGEGAATWTFQGIATPSGRGMGGHFCGMVLFNTAAPRLARLNNICGIVSADVDETGTMTAEMWEWK